MTAAPVAGGTERPWMRPASMRLIRASKRWRELDATYRRAGELWSADPPSVSVNQAGLDGSEPLDVRFNPGSDKFGAFLPELNDLASEVVHHTRTALEYVAYALAWHDSGRVHENTKFPVESEPEHWGQKVRKALPGVSTEHRKAVRGYQPFAGCAWTGPLHDLSIADKHRELITVSPTFSGEFKLNNTVGPDPTDPTRRLVHIRSPAITLHLLGGEKLYDVLHPIFDGAMELVNGFAVEFGEPLVELGTVDEYEQSVKQLQEQQADE